MDFEIWFRNASSKRLADAGYKSTEFRDAKWQVLNAFRKDGFEVAYKETERLIELKRKNRIQNVENTDAIE